MAIKRLSIPFDGTLARHERERQGLTLEDLAARCEKAGLKIDHSTISRWEAGIFGPTARRLKVLADALNVDVDDLCLTANSQPRRAS